MVPTVQIVGGFLQTFQANPASQKSGNISVSQFLNAIQNGAAGPGK